MNATKTSVWILGDQLLLDHPALHVAEEETDRGQICVVLIESMARLTRLPYQRKKLVLLLSAMRHYAEALREQGYVVDYIQAHSTLAGLREHIDTWQPNCLITMAAADYGGRHFQTERVAANCSIPVRVLPNSQFLIHQHPSLNETLPNKRVVMERFYRSMRKHFDILLTDDGNPAGGAWNFDRDNRKPLPKRGLETPPLPAFPPDAITSAAIETVDAIDHGVGHSLDFDLAVTHAAAQEALDDFVTHRLPSFGPYEDAMSADNAILFHSLLSPYLNIGLLEPLDLIRRAERAYDEGHAPINSVEGFIRQILGWREYVYWQYWRQMPALLTANSWQHSDAMPQFFWDGVTDMHCLHQVVDRVTELGYSHHIERLMLVCNFCMLAEVDPAVVNDWFLTFYVDAYEWVVTPNVIGMGLNADGGTIATKPYIASANYINKMGNYCQGCRFDPKQRTGEDACPFNFLYWNFLLKHEALLRANPRFGPAVLGLRHLDEDERKQVQANAADFLAALPRYTP